MEEYGIIGGVVLITERHTVKVLLESGNSWISTINGTIEEIKNYYIDQRWNISTVEEETKGITHYELCTDCIVLN